MWVRVTLLRLHVPGLHTLDCRPGRHAHLTPEHGYCPHLRCVDCVIDGTWHLAALPSNIDLPCVPTRLPSPVSALVSTPADEMVAVARLVAEEVGAAITVLQHDTLSPEFGGLWGCVPPTAIPRP